MSSPHRSKIHYSGKPSSSRPSFPKLMYLITGAASILLFDIYSLRLGSFFSTFNGNTSGTLLHSLHVSTFVAIKSTRYLIYHNGLMLLSIKTGKNRFKMNPVVKKIEKMMSKQGQQSQILIE